MSPRFRPPIRRRGDGFVIDVGSDEAALIARLVGELRSLLTDPDPDSDAAALLVRLFPVVHPDDEQMEAEYQRLMRDELVASKLSAFELVEATLADESGAPIDEARLVAVMQSVNSIRLVLGTMLGVTDDPDAPEVASGFENSPEYALYGYLSWLLEWCVRTLTRAE